MYQKTLYEIKLLSLDCIDDFPSYFDLNDNFQERTFCQSLYLFKKIIIQKLMLLKMQNKMLLNWIKAGNNYYQIFKIINFQEFYYKIIKMQQQPSQMLNDYDKGKKLALAALSKVKRDDIIHRGFLKPIEIALKTFKTESTDYIDRIINERNSFLTQQGQAKKRLHSLPHGLKIAVKQSIGDNRYTLKDVISIENESTFERMKENNQDNILSLMKIPEGIELAICVCMYSQDKKMLKSTLAGISENIANIVAREGVSSDKIGVFVIMDGIEKVDKSVVGYFQELQRSNNINLGQNLPPSLTMDELAKRAYTMSQKQINQEQFNNVNNFLFNIAQLQDRNQRRFSMVKEQYSQIKKLFSTIQTLKKQKTLFDGLPSKVRPFFFNQARLTKKKMTSLSQREVNHISEQKLIEQFAYNIKKSKPIILKALQQCERYCKQYIISRDQLAFLACFRNKIKMHNVFNDDSDDQEQDQKSIKNKLIAQGSDRKMVEEITEQKLTTYMNLYLCVKYKNSGKLSSHNWFFNGFCKQLKPKYAILLDVGLKPEGHSLQKMFRYMKKNEKIGGVCGYMSLKIQQLQEQQQTRLQDVDFLSKIFLKIADIQRTQQVEYHFAHLMDKAFQSSFGFIHVLPGAFSAYNMKAILDYNVQDDDELLRAYFKSIQDKILNTKIVLSQLSLSDIILRLILPDLIYRCINQIDHQSEEQLLYNQNIYLAEDRILCMGIYKKGFQIKFLPDAYSEVDPIKTVHSLLGQRKRWINGSFFAFEKVKQQLNQHQKKQGYQIGLNLQIFYLTLLNSLAYFAPSLFLFTIHIAMDAFRSNILTSVFAGVIGDPNNSSILYSFVYTIDFIYVMLVGSVVYFSLHLTSNSKHFKPYIYATSTIMGIFAVSVFIVLLVDVLRGLIDNQSFLSENQSLIQSIPGGISTINSMRWILIGSTIVYTLPILLYICLFKKLNILCQIMMGSFSFLFYGPTYLNILNIYSLCRMDDISWGTKGLESAEQSKNIDLRNKWYLIKYIHVGKFIIWNVIIGVILLMVGSDFQPKFFITIIMVSIITLTLSIKIIIAMIYMISYKIRQCCQQVQIKRIEDLQIGLQSRIQRKFDLYQQDIMDEVKAHLFVLAQKYNNNNYQETLRSFIQLSRTQTHIEKSFQKQKEEFVSRSNITNQLSHIEGWTEGSQALDYHIKCLNQYSLPIQTNKALDNISELNKKTSNQSNKSAQMKKKKSSESIHSSDLRKRLSNCDKVEQIVAQQQNEQNDDQTQKPNSIEDREQLQNQSIQYLTPQVIHIRPKKKNSQLKSSRFKPIQ